MQQDVILKVGIATFSLRQTKVKGVNLSCCSRLIESGIAFFLPINVEGKRQDLPSLTQIVFTHRQASEPVRLSPRPSFAVAKGAEPYVFLTFAWG